VQNSGIKPERNQKTINRNTNYTAADVVYPDGRKQTAMLSSMMDLHKKEIESLDVMDGDDTWCIQICDDDWDPDQMAENTRLHNDLSTFPMMVTSRLPSEWTGSQIKLRLMPDGKVEKIEEDFDFSQIPELPFMPMDISESISAIFSQEDLVVKDNRPTEEWKQTIRNYILQKGYFDIEFHSGVKDDALFDIAMDHGQEHPEMKRLLQPIRYLIEYTEVCKIYKYQSVVNSKHLEEKDRIQLNQYKDKYFNQKGKCLSINLKDTTAVDDVLFWWRIFKHNLNAVFGAKVNLLDLRRIFQKAEDPSFITNITTVRVTIQ